MTNPVAAPKKTMPWAVAGFALVAFVIQLVPALRSVLLYDRPMINEGQLWRIWTGHLVHFGWPHFIIDTGLLLILGWYGERLYPAFTRWALLLMPPFISAWIYWLDPEMIRYGGLSALNLGLLLYVAAQGWKRDWTDWFWPAVIAIYLGELVFEHYRGGQGGGAIRFDDASVRVATSAHVASAVYAVLALVFIRLIRRSGRPSSREAAK